jgi:hypothetical protein
MDAVLIKNRKAVIRGFPVFLFKSSPTLLIKLSADLCSEITNLVLVDPTCSCYAPVRVSAGALFFLPAVGAA